MQNNVSNDSTKIQLSQPILGINAHKTKKDLRWNSVSNTFEWIHQFCVTDPDKRSHALNKVNSELGSYILG